MWYWVSQLFCFLLAPPPQRSAAFAPNQANQRSLLSSAALCQVFDSIFLDIPMSRVKFNVNAEYAYLQNFKVLQSRSPLAATPRPLLPTLAIATPLHHNSGHHLRIENILAMRFADSMLSPQTASRSIKSTRLSRSRPS